VGEPPAVMSTTFTYALILTACQVVFTLILYFMGFETDKIAHLNSLSWLGLIFTIAILGFGIKAAREAAPDKSLSFGRGVAVGTLISLYAGLMSGVYRFIHLTFINPSFMDYEMDLIRQKWVAAHMSDAQMEQAEKFTRFFIGPTCSAILTPIFSVVFGVVISLILSAILKRAAPAPAEPPVAAA
jgi:hypothetical protein